MNNNNKEEYWQRYTRIVQNVHGLTQRGARGVPRSDL